MYLYQGNDKKISVTIKDSTGIAVDLTGASAEYQISRKFDNTALVSGTIADSSITVTDAGAGKLDIDLTDVETDGLEPGKYHHELKVTLSTGMEYTVFFEELEVRDSLFV